MLRVCGGVKGSGCFDKDEYQSYESKFNDWILIECCHLSQYSHMEKSIKECVDSIQNFTSSIDKEMAAMLD